MDMRWAMLAASMWLILVPFLVKADQDASRKSSKLYSCLQNCAYCVQFWEYGLYNGRRCAKRCLRQQGREVVDPDCNNPKMFNYSPRIIDLLLEMQQNQADEPGSAEEDEDDEMEQNDDASLGVKNRSERRAPSATDDRVRQEDDISEHYKVEIKAQHRRKSKHERGGGRKGQTNVLFASTTTKSPLPYEKHHPHLRRLSQNGDEAKKKLGLRKRRKLQQ